MLTHIITMKTEVEKGLASHSSNDDNDSSQFSNQVAVVGYKPSFKQNQKAVKESNNKSDDFIEDNEIHDKTIRDPNSTKSEMSDSKMVEAMQKTI